jgi:hypothetical protein
MIPWSRSRRPAHTADDVVRGIVFQILQDRIRRRGPVPPTRHDAGLITFAAIETSYNSTSRRSSQGYLSPVAFETTQRSHYINYAA